MQGCDDDERHSCLAEARRYAHLAAAYGLPPVLVVMCGLPGTGKSWAARTLGRPFEAVVVRSDIVRQSLLAGSNETDDSLDTGIYARDRIDATYRTLEKRAAKHLAEGRSVVLDATFGERARRDRIQDLARRVGVPWVLVHRTCDEVTVRARMEARALDGRDPSQADYRVFEHLGTRFQAPHEVLPGNRITVYGEVTPGDLAGRVIDALIFAVLEMTAGNGVCSS